ncbi:hypothetical protein [Rhizobium anhuiense]|uniref:hypothetical protein n=1 Tax=Rhizobium anhuiense TaxID=1184720 RepID=UPI000F78422F|nr:hypothetical protein [Rhizobium anhuiense]
MKIVTGGISEVVVLVHLLDASDRLLKIWNVRNPKGICLQVELNQVMSDLLVAERPLRYTMRGQVGFQVEFQRMRKKEIASVHIGLRILTLQTLEGAQVLIGSFEQGVSENAEGLRHLN